MYSLAPNLMENIQFDVDGKSFECIECQGIVHAEVVQNKPRPITCAECGTVYNVAKNEKGGLSVTVITRSEPDVISQEEEELEEEYLDEQEEEEEY